MCSTREEIMILLHETMPQLLGLSVWVRTPGGQCRSRITKTVEVICWISVVLLGYPWTEGHFDRSATIFWFSTMGALYLCSWWYWAFSVSRGSWGKRDESCTSTREGGDKEAALRNAPRNGRAHRRLVDRGKKMLKSLSLSQWESFLEGCEMVLRGTSLHSLFAFQPLHNLHLKRTKLVKDWTIEYLLSNELRSNPDRLQ